MDYYVIKNPATGLWEVKLKGGVLVSNHGTQNLAYSDARNRCERGGGGEVIVWGLDGKIQYRNTIPPKRDPFPPRG